MPVQKMKIKRKYNSRTVFFIQINILKFMDKRTVITCIYTVTESVYSSIQMNKDNLTINNDKMWVCAIRTKQQLAEVCF